MFGEIRYESWDRFWIFMTVDYWSVPFRDMPRLRCRFERVGSDWIVQSCGW